MTLEPDIDEVKSKLLSVIFTGVEKPIVINEMVLFHLLVIRFLLLSLVFSPCSS